MKMLQNQAEQQRQASAAARLERAQAGESVVGCIPRGPHRLAGAQAQLEREIARLQAKLDRRAAIIAAGRRPMPTRRGFLQGCNAQLAGYCRPDHRRGPARAAIFGRCADDG
ncbi:hypothetical protein [Pseudonocardia spinosispora]|uniref:hypothetical protein n=1 Tax=Pseudonocardia spinosispora TaxID=103441 RepID=UPI0003FEA908|nr:hypothetical protein [Pseudonocardia spinosispora]